MRYIALFVALLLIAGCAGPSQSPTKEQFKPTIRDLGGGFYAFDRHPEAFKKDNAAMGNEALQDGIAGWINEHTELEVRIILPLEMVSAGDGRYVSSSFLIMTSKKGVK